VSLEQLQGLSRDEVLVVKLPAKRSDQTLAPMQGAAFSWFWGTLWRFRHFYVESMVATVVANILTLASVFFTMNVYDRVVPTQAYASLWTLAIGTTVAIVMEFIMRWLKARLVDLGGKKADLAINATLLREVMGIRLENRPQSVGVFASSMRDFESLRDFFSSASLVVLADMPFVLLFLALIAMVGGPLAWIPALAVPVLLIQGIWAQKPLMKAMRANMKESGDKQSVLVESVLNLELLKAHNAESYLQRRWETSNKAGSDSYKEIRAITNWIMGWTSALTQLVLAKHLLRRRETQT
jgi:ATP-binding cassette subfamily C protein LapB